MDTLDTVIKLMKPGCYMASIDLRDAYYTIPIHLDHQKYLKFVANGELYQYTCLPNGLASAPRIFTKLMKPIYSTLRSMGQIISGYIDDSYLQGDSVAACSSNVKASATLMHSVGFFLHPDKSVLSPAQTVTFLGFVLNSLDMTVLPTPEKISKTIHCCTELLQTLQPTILQVSRVVGILISNLPGVEFGKLHYRSLEMDKIAALKNSGSNYNAVMELCLRSINDLKWWIENISVASKSIVKSNPSYIIKSDASKLGWGAVLDSQAIGGRWTVSERSAHINYLELLAAFFALKAFCLNRQCCSVQLQLDNSTAVTYINNMGGTKSLGLNDLTIQMWEWSTERSIWISAVHIAGISNHDADKQSRQFHDQHEYMLNVSSFRTILAKYPHLNVDLFASRLNHQLEHYVSWKPDPGCIAVDAFSLNWQSYNFYAFPPFSLIARCLQKICVDKASGIIVVPLWPTQTWFSSLFQMLYQHPWILLAKPTLLQHPVKQAVHPLHQKLNLLVCPVSGIPSRASVFQQTLPTSLCNLGDQVLRNSMRHTLDNGWNFVIKDKLLTIHHQ